MGRKSKKQIEAENRATNQVIAEQIRQDREAEDALEYAIPISEEALQEIDADRAELYFVIKQQLFNLSAMAKACQDLDEHEASQLGVYKNVHNIRNSITELVNYAMLIRMVCENALDDLEKIFAARREFKQQILLKIAQAEENARQQARARAEAERKKNQLGIITDETPETPVDERSQVFENDSAIELLQPEENEINNN